MSTFLLAFAGGLLANITTLLILALVALVTIPEEW